MASRFLAQVMSERTKEDKSRVFFCEIFRPNALGLLPTAHQLVTLVLASTKELEEELKLKKSTDASQTS